MARRASQITRIADRRTKAVELFCRGRTYVEIAAALEYSPSQARKDVAAARAEWAEARRDDLDAMIDREVAILEHVHAEAWKALEASGRPEMVRTHEVIQATPAAAGEATAQPGLKKTGERVRGRLIEARLFDTIMRARERIEKLRGLIPEAANDRPPPPGAQGWGTSEAVRTFMESLAPDEIAMFQRMRARMLTIAGQATVVADGNQP